MSNFAFENKSTIFTINGETNARKSGLFNHIYLANGPRYFDYTGVNICSDGGIEIHCFWTNITEQEQETFMSSPLELYKKELPNGTAAFSIRGALSTEFMTDPTIYPDNRIDLITKKKECIAYLVDTANGNKILGIRLFHLSDDIYKSIQETAQNALEQGLTTLDFAEGYRNYVIPYTASYFLKKSKYLGRDKGSAKIVNLQVLPA